MDLGSHLFNSDLPVIAVLAYDPVNSTKEHEERVSARRLEKVDGLINLHGSYLTIVEPCFTFSYQHITIPSIHTALPPLTFLCQVTDG